MRPPVLVRGTQASVAPHLSAQESERAARGRLPVRPAEPARGARHAADRERVPRREDLLVASRAHAPLARGEKLVARRGEARLASRLERPGDAQVPRAVLEVRRLVQAVAAREERIVLRPEQRLRFIPLPDVEAAFLMLAVRVERGVVPALGRLHLAHQPAGGADRAALEQRLAADEPGIREQAEERAVVVEHFLEMRDGPMRVHAVAAEPAPQLVVDAALAHALERDESDVALAFAQAELEVARMREFRRRAEAAVARIEARAQQPEQRADRLRAQGLGLRRRLRPEARERREELGVLRFDRRALLAPG